MKRDTIYIAQVPFEQRPLRRHRLALSMDYSWFWIVLFWTDGPFERSVLLTPKRCARPKRYLVAIRLRLIGIPYGLNSLVSSNIPSDSTRRTWENPDSVRNVLRKYSLNPTKWKSYASI